MRNYCRRRMDRVSERECEILLHFAAGYESREIAEKLTISERTVRQHSHYVQRKLYAKNIRHAAVIALRDGMITTDEMLAMAALENLREAVAA